MSDYICNECGFKFDEPLVIREDHGIREGGYEERDSVCPSCGGSYEMLSECQKCETECKVEELYNGLCEKCLRESITYQNALEYMTSGAKHADEVDLLEHFMFSEFGIGDYPGKHSSAELKAILKAEYNRRAMTDSWAKQKMFEAFTLKRDFMENIRDFIIQDDGGFTKMCFADWLAKKGGTNG